MACKQWVLFIFVADEKQRLYELDGSVEMTVAHVDRDVVRPPSFTYLWLMVYCSDCG